VVGDVGLLDPLGELRVVRVVLQRLERLRRERLAHGFERDRARGHVRIVAEDVQPRGGAHRLGHVAHLRKRHRGPHELGGVGGGVLRDVVALALHGRLVLLRVLPVFLDQRVEAVALRNAVEHLVGGGLELRVEYVELAVQRVRPLRVRGGVERLELREDFLDAEAVLRVEREEHLLDGPVSRGVVDDGLVAVAPRELVVLGVRRVERLLVLEVAVVGLLKRGVRHDDVLGHVFGELRVPPILFDLGALALKRRAVLLLEAGDRGLALLLGGQRLVVHDVELDERVKLLLRRRVDRGPVLLGKRRQAEFLRLFVLELLGDDRGQRVLHQRIRVLRDVMAVQQELIDPGVVGGEHLVAHDLHVAELRDDHGRRLGRGRLGLELIALLDQRVVDGKAHVVARERVGLGALHQRVQRVEEFLVRVDLRGLEHLFVFQDARVRLGKQRVLFGELPVLRAAADDIAEHAAAGQREYDQNSRQRLGHAPAPAPVPADGVLRVLSCHGISSLQ